MKNLGLEKVKNVVGPDNKPLYKVLSQNNEYVSESKNKNETHILAFDGTQGAFRLMCKAASDIRKYAKHYQA